MNTRRAFLLVVAGASLSACGFHPRGEQALPTALHNVSLQGSQAGELTQALSQLLQSNGAVVISSTPLPMDSISIRLSQIHIQRREALTDRQANIRQIELLQRVRLDAAHADGRTIIEGESFEALRSSSYNPLSLLAQGEEEQRLRRELNEQLAQTILARLKSAVRNSADLRSKPEGDRTGMSEIRSRLAAP